MSLRLRGRPKAAIGLLLFIAHLAGLSVAHGQAASSSQRPDPLNPKAEVPPATYKSVLGAYRPAGEVRVGSWREANDTVNRIGGWRAYAREANAPEGAVAAPSATPAGPAASAAPGAAVAPGAASSAAAPAPSPAASAPGAPTPARRHGGHGHHGKP